VCWHHRFAAFVEDGVFAGWLSTARIVKRFAFGDELMVRLKGNG